MEICFSSNVPDDTYFRTGEVEPEIDGHTLTLYNGDGRHRSWGHPGVTSTVVVEAIDFVAVHVGFHHKHGGGQFWRFYNVNGLIEQVAWKALPDETRQIVLDAIEAGKAPSWARSPGKVRKDYHRPSQHKFTAYKIVVLAEDGTMHSLYMPASRTYEIGKTAIEQARPDHGGGLYVYADRDTLIATYQAGALVTDRLPGQRAVIECECWGNIEYYSPTGACISHWVRKGETASVKKMSVTYCRPIRILETFTV